MKHKQNIFQEEKYKSDQVNVMHRGPPECGPELNDVKLEDLPIHIRCRMGHSCGPTNSIKVHKKVKGLVISLSDYLDGKLEKIDIIQ